MAVDFSHKKILVIDDFPEMRRSLRRMLQSFGAVDVDDAPNGEEAIEKIALKPYDIVMCDYNLGAGKDGQQVLEEAKHRELIKYSTVFIMITAENTLEMVMGAVEYKPDDYLTKPFTKEVLKNRLERLIERKGDLADIDSAMERKEYLKAMTLCDQRIDANPKNALEFLKLKGELCLAAGEYAEAQAVYEKVLAMRSIPWALLGLGKMYFLSGDHLQAKQQFERVIEENRMSLEAYDWLAKTMEGLGDLAEAQRILHTAAQLSPKAILRQKALGEIAYRNKDLETAEKSFKAAVNLGKNSCLKSATDYTGLAKVLVDRNAADEALKVVGEARSEFKDSADATLQTTVMEGIIYKEMKRDGEAKQALDKASRLYAEMGGKVSADVAMDMAKACFVLGEKEQGEKLMQEVVRNHHEDEKVLQKAENVFKDAHMHEEGAKIISATRAEVIDINNKGVHLVKEGKLAEAIEFFEQAVGGLPENKTINMNAAQALIMHVQRNGRNEQFLYKARQYLDRVRRLDPANSKCQKLLGIHERLAAGQGLPA